MFIYLRQSLAVSFFLPFYFFIGDDETMEANIYLAIIAVILTLTTAFLAVYRLIHHH